MRPIRLVGSFLCCVFAPAACSSSSADSGAPAPSGTQGVAAAGSGNSRAASAPAPSSALPAVSGAPTAVAGPDPRPAAGGLDVSGLDPNKPALVTTSELMAFVEVTNPRSLRKRWKSPEDLLSQTFGVGSVWFSNQGNVAISHPHGSRKQCLEGLKDLVLQTAEQRRVCGADYMVPIYEDGKPETAKTCIDVFEFPEQAV